MAAERGGGDESPHYERGRAPRAGPLIVVAAWVLAGLLALAATATAAPVELRTDRFTLAFLADGTPHSLQVAPEGRELLNVQSPGGGFVLRNRSAVPIRLSDLTLAPGGKLVARSENGTQSVVFAVRQAPKYLAFRIERLLGIPRSGELTLHFEINAHTDARVNALDYMTEASNYPGSPRVNWRYLWHRSKSDPLGGFALYCRRDDDDEDDTLLRIWVGEGLPHPRVKEPWTLERAREWVAVWQRAFADQSRFAVEAETLQELYQAVDYAKQADIRAIYLMPWVWRGAYWPTNMRNDAINRRLFPRGEKDMRAYADHLERSGIRLLWHYVSGGIGFEDPDYVGSRPDRRLATWAHGRLARPAGKADTTLHVRPAPGTDMAYSIPWSVANTFDALPPAMQVFHDFHTVRVGDELVRVGSFEDTDTPVWRLAGCTRGLFKTVAAAHPAGHEFAGLVAPYGQNFVPENDSTLLDEIARNYAGVMNRCKVALALYDGGEIHAYNGGWGYRKFTSRVYENLDHPVIANSSGGVAPPCHIEYLLNATRRASDPGCTAVILPHHPSRVATTVDDADFLLGLGAASGARSFGFGGHDRGIRIADLKQHGQTGAILAGVRSWKAISALLTPQQREQIRPRSHPTSKLDLAGWHPGSDLIYHPARVAGGWELTPVKALTRREGDVLWRNNQEHGVIGPRQYVKPGQALLLENPFQPQPLRFIIRVLPAFDYASAANIPLTPDPAAMQNSTDTRLRREGDALLLEEQNPRAEAVWRERLPSWQRRADMSTHRGIGMWVTGDAKGEILCLQIPGRDYTARVDFEGRRYVEIPNGEVAWHDGFWGWRIGTAKFADYSKVDRLGLGLGHVPAGAAVRVAVEGIRALKEIPAVLEHPRIRAGGGWLRVDGSVRTGQYLVFDGGAAARAYDENWHLVREISVAGEAYEMPTGWGDVSIEADGAGPPWLEVQFRALGEPLMVRDPSPVG